MTMPLKIKDTPTIAPTLNAASGFVNTDLSKVPAAYRAAFKDAQNRINDFILTPKRKVVIGGKVQYVGVDIAATVKPIDGVGGTLGRAGPTHILKSDGLPVRGIMEFDVADVANMQANGQLGDVILHEMLHVVGSGTLWSHKKVIQGAGSANPRFVGSRAVAEYRKLVPTGAPSSIPIEADGGPGTRDGHWDELAFGDELLTGYISGNKRPLSRMSIAAIADLGYAVDLNKADAYSLPKKGALVGLSADRIYSVKRPAFVIIENMDVLA